MKKGIKIFTIVVCVLTVCAGYIWLYCNPVIIHKPYPEHVFSNDKFYNPVDTIDFSQGKNRIIIYTNFGDINFLPSGMRRWTLLECKDNITIEDVKNNFVFERVSDDLCETTDYDSRIFFIKDGELIFTDKFMVDGRIVSLYLKNTAWTKAVNDEELIESFSKFKPIYLPIIKL